MIPSQHARMQDILEHLDAEEAEIWREYLEETRGQTGAHYKEIEPWAWQRLLNKMKVINACRKKYKAA